MSYSDKPGGMAYCPHCLHPMEYVLPVEPLFDMQLAATLIPMSQTAMRSYLVKHKHEFPRRYRKDIHKRLHRLLSASEIRLIRSRVLRFKDSDRKRREMDVRGN